MLVSRMDKRKVSACIITLNEEEHIREACEASLKRLKTDHLDLYQMHHIDRLTPWEEIWQAMETLVQQGKVLYYGISEWTGSQIAEAAAIAQTHNFQPMVVNQPQYSMLARGIERDVIPVCVREGIGQVVFSPLASTVRDSHLAPSRLGLSTTTRASRVRM